MPVLTTVPDRSQAVPSRRNGDSRINVPSWVPKKHMSHLHSRHKRDQPVPLLSRVPSPHPNLDSKLPHLRPASKWCLDLHLSPPPISRSRKSWSPWQESNKPFRSQKQARARDNKSMTWPGSMQQTVLNRHRQEKQCNQAKPRSRGTQPATPTNTHITSLSGHYFFSFHHFIMRVVIISTYCVSNGRLPTLPIT
jgi:hypothetical protein